MRRKLQKAQHEKGRPARDRNGRKRPSRERSQQQHRRDHVSCDHTAINAAACTTNSNTSENAGACAMPMPRRARGARRQWRARRWSRARRQRRAPRWSRPTLAPAPLLRGACIQAGIPPRPGPTTLATSIQYPFVVHPACRMRAFAQRHPSGIHTCIRLCTGIASVLHRTPSVRHQSESVLHQPCIALHQSAGGCPSAHFTQTDPMLYSDRGAICP